jgi:2'-phosphotransferase
VRWEESELMIDLKLSRSKFTNLKPTFEEIEAIVQNNDKQRFTLKPVKEFSTQSSASPEDYLIRANQGHSIKLDSSALLTPLTEVDVPSTGVVHGTFYPFWPAILSSGGLSRMGRNHIHFAPAQAVVGDPALSVVPVAGSKDEHTAETEAVETQPVEEKEIKVISGMRTDAQVLVYIDMPKAIKAGLKFWKSDNEVILTEGNEEGLLPLEFIIKAVDRKRGLGVLWENGEVVKEIPEDLVNMQIPHKGGKGKRGGRDGRRGRGRGIET